MKIDNLIPLIDFIFKSFLYYGALKLRKLDVKVMTCVLCGGASILTGLIPFPEMLHLALAIVVAGFFIVRDTDTEIYPNGIIVPFAVEVVDAFLLSYAVIPLVAEIK
jgi:hypothetical protein